MMRMVGTMVNISAKNEEKVMSMTLESKACLISFVRFLTKNITWYVIDQFLINIFDNTSHNGSLPSAVGVAELKACQLTH